MKKRRLKKKNLFLFLMIMFFLILLIISSYKIISYLKDNYENKKIKESILKNSITVIEDVDDNKEKQYNIDFKTLKQKNSDTIAYIKVENTNIDYIVVRGEDNSYYLNHNFNKNWNVSGWIFGDYRNKFDGSDKNLIIYGHNTRDGSMFDTLKYVLNKEWYENNENHKIVLVTEKGTYYYQAFSTYSIEPEDYYISTYFKNNNEFSNFVNTIKLRSVYDYGVEVNYKDKILTLSSCIGDGRKRVVLHAKLIES